MMKTNAIKTFLVLLVVNSLCASSANSIGFEHDVYVQNSGQVSIELVYDFSVFTIIGGSVDITYDADFIEFVSFTRAPFAPDVTPGASPTGTLLYPGFYSGVGIGHLGPFGTGINSAGAIGTFVFSVIGTPSHSTPCGVALCITANESNPFISVAGVDVSAELLANGFDSAEVVVPLPATLWFLFSGLLLLTGLGRTHSA